MAKEAAPQGPLLMQRLIDASTRAPAGRKSEALGAELEAIWNDDRLLFRAILVNKQCVAPREEVGDIPLDVATRRYLHLYNTGECPWLREEGGWYTI